MKIPKYIVLRLDTKDKGTTITVTDISDRCEVIEHEADTPQTMYYPQVDGITPSVIIADTPKTEEDYFLELMDKVMRGEISDATANQVWYEYINKQTEISDTPQTEDDEPYEYEIKALHKEYQEPYCEIEECDYHKYCKERGQTDCGWK